MQKNYRVIGLMSGSSLDGLDICYVEFTLDEDAGKLTAGYKILKAECIEYDPRFRNKVKDIASESAFEFAKMHAELGGYFGGLVKEFIAIHNITGVDLICSHGQTIFHQPKQGFTSQIGCGAQLAAQTGYKVVCDLRSTDVAYGGQGAPIVPIAEKYLFSSHRAFLNIGGIANISIHKSDSEVIAFDICAANTMLNLLAQKLEMDFDEGGMLASRGKIHEALLQELNNISFCNDPAPKSLGTEHILRYWMPLFENYKIPVEDQLATATEHIAKQVKNALKDYSSTGTLLVTGGGALNDHLIKRIRHHISSGVDVPDLLTIQFKEALAMAFIGLLRILELPNTLSTVTGARRDSIAGAVYLP